MDNLQYIGKFFKHNRFNSAYVYIHNVASIGRLEWTMFDKFSYKQGVGGYNLNSWHQISQEEFIDAFDKISSSWRSEWI